jgi:hypothetical protein
VIQGQTNGEVAQPPPQNTFQSRLGGVTSGRIVLPWVALLHGQEKVGKSSFGKDAPKSIFIASEEGTSNLDVHRYPEPTCWEDMQYAIYDLTNSSHDYKTLVVDTVDWFEPFVTNFTCRVNGWNNIEDPGYGKGQAASIEDWRGWLRSLEVLRKTKWMNILLLAHSHLKTFKNPMGDDYDRWELKLAPKTSALLREWSEDILFAAFRISTVKEKSGRGSKVRGIMSDSDRLMYTQRRPPFDAGNRHGLPSEMPLDFAAYGRAVAEFQTATPAMLVAKIQKMLETIDVKVGDRKTYVDKVTAYLARPAVSASQDKLSQVSIKVAAQIAAFDEEVATSPPAATTTTTTKEIGK